MSAADAKATNAKEAAAEAGAKWLSAKVIDLEGSAGQKKVVFEFSLPPPNLMTNDDRGDFHTWNVELLIKYDLDKEPRMSVNTNDTAVHILTHQAKLTANAVARYGRGPNAQTLTDGTQYTQYTQYTRYAATDAGNTNYACGCSDNCRYDVRAKIEFGGACKLRRC